MTQTKAADLIVPEVWGAAMMGTILGKAVMVNLVDTDDELVGEPGDTVHFPKFNYIGDADELQEGVAMTPVKLTMTDSKATIKEAGKAVELTDTAVLTALGSPSDNARTQLMISVSRKIDKDIITEAAYTVTGSTDPENPNTAPLKIDVSAVGDGVFSWAAFVGGVALLGDDYDPNELAGVVVHSKQHTDLLLDERFISSESFGADAVILRGQVGRIGNVSIFVTDRITKTGANYNALIIVKGAIQLKYKRRPLVENDRDILSRTNIITTNVHYAVKRVSDRGVIVVTTK